MLINILLYFTKGLTEAGIAVLVLEITFQLSDLLYSDSVITYIYFIGTQYQTIILRQGCYFMILR